MEIPDKRVFLLDHKPDNYIKFRRENDIINLLLNKIKTAIHINLDDMDYCKLEFHKYNQKSHEENIKDLFDNINLLPNNYIFVAYISFFYSINGIPLERYYQFIFTRHEIFTEIPCLKNKLVINDFMAYQDNEYLEYYKKNPNCKKVYSLFYLYELYRDFIIQKKLKSINTGL